MTTDQPEGNGLLIGFLDDYFAECDEHMTAVRRDLLALESHLGAATVDRSLLDGLFRAFHTLKGLSGMVGVKEAEQLAHHTESYLRALRDGRLPLTRAGMDALIWASKLLEQVILARKSRAAPPEIAPFMEKLDALLSARNNLRAPDTAPDGRTVLPEGLGLALEPHDAERLGAALAGGARAWVVGFTPSPELAQRGISVNTVRTRLREVGELVQAVPKVTPEGGVTFEFLVASRLDASAFSQWEVDGLTCRLLEQGAPVPPEADSDAPPEHLAPPWASSLAPSSVVRVDLSRLDEIMRLVGELVISRSRLEDGLQRAGDVLEPGRWRPLQETNLAMERQLRDLREAVMRVRLVSIGEIFNRMQFVVRDLAQESGKEVRLELIGQETEIDKFVVERMLDPLMHLVRNAVSHGLEPPEERLAKGKPVEGRITLRAAAAGDLVVVEVADDGRGLLTERIEARAISLGLLKPGVRLDERSALEVLCSPGFSTREEADMASGRGVGMSVVRDAVAEMGGSLEVESRPDLGTCFTVRLPLTLAIADALIVTVDGHTFAVPQSLVEEVLEVGDGAVQRLENNEVIGHRGGVLALQRLSALFHLGGGRLDRFHVLVIGSGLSGVALAVDRIVGRREIVVRAITDPLVKVEGISGATELGDGRVVLILDTGALLRGRRQDNGRSVVTHKAEVRHGNGA
jgi:two-component system chemotaxis sensor kinase CheA